MSDFETRLSIMMRDLVEEPPRQLEPEDVFAQRSGRGRSRVLASIAAAFVVALTAGATLLGTSRHEATRPGEQHRTHQSSGTTGSKRSSDPAVLDGGTWTLDRLHGFAGAAITRPDAPVPLTFRSRASAAAGGLTSVGANCAGTTAAISRGHMTFAHPFVTPTQTDCGLELGRSQTKFLFDVLHGRTTWFVSGNRLFITHPGVGSLELSTTSRTGGAVHATLHLDRTAAPADGQPIDGYVTVVNETGKPVTIHDACNGWISVGLTNSHASFGASSRNVACANDYLPKGMSRIPITVATTYQLCSQRRHTHSGQTNLPLCAGSGHNQSPPLPPGRYQTRVETYDVTPRIAATTPIAVILTKP